MRLTEQILVVRLGRFWKRIGSVFMCFDVRLWWFLSQAASPAKASLCSSNILASLRCLLRYCMDWLAGDMPAATDSAVVIGPVFPCVETWEAVC